MEKEKSEREKETQVGQEQLIADMMRKPPRHFQCRVCCYTFEMSPCAHGMRGKNLTCPECGGKLKRWITTVVKGIAVQRTVMYVGSVIKMDLGGNKDVRYFRTRCI